VLVDRFLTAIDDPDDPHWGQGATSLPAAPHQICDRRQLRRRLRRRLRREPWTLDPDAAAWVIRAGIRFLCPPLPPLPTPAEDDATTGRDGGT
jgi:hypothetical protein